MNKPSFLAWNYFVIFKNFKNFNKKKIELKLFLQD